MEWKEVTSFFVVFLCRFILFLFIIVLSLVILGIPNVNTCFLTVSMLKSFLLQRAVYSCI